MALAAALSNPAFRSRLPAIPAIIQPGLCSRIVTHPSFHGEIAQRFEFSESGGNDYRRDALLGDGLLKCFLTERLYGLSPRLVPGAATKILSTVWSNTSLAKLAEGYDLHQALRAAPEQKASLALNRDVRASLFEARIYAIHVDGKGSSDNYEAVKTFLSTLFTPILEAEKAALVENGQSDTKIFHAHEDYVSQLNIWAQQMRRVVEYTCDDTSGPSHAPEFTVIVRIDDVVRGTGAGSSIRRARQAAAADAIATIVK